jgi:anaerobic selenocysteine-containing dehydrogenase
MKLTRRNFLAWAGIAATGAIACDLFDDDLRIQSPVAIPEDLVTGRDNWYATHDSSVPGGQGLLVRVMEGRAKKVRGNPRFPTNQGKQSPAADAILQSLYHPDRIAGPMLRNGPRGAGLFRPISWEEALNRLNAALDERGDGMLLITEPRNGAFSGICTEFANAFGGQHLAFDATDDSAYRQAVQDVIGSGALPYHDIANAETLVSFGSDFLSTWGAPTTYSVGYGAFRSGEHRGRHVHFDPRYSLTAANADKWLPIAPGSEGYAALALAWSLIESGAAEGDVDGLTGGRGADALNNFRPDNVAAVLQIPDAALGGDTIAQFFEYLASKVAHGGLAIGGGGSAGAYSNGKFNADAVLALNHVLGNVGNVGGLLVNAAADAGSPQIGTLNDWRRAAADLGNGTTRLVIVHNADPVYGLPAGVGFAGALNNENVAVISSSCFIDETTAMADLLIPDRAALEDWGFDIPEPSPGHAVYAVQQPVVNPLADLDPRSFADVMLSAASDLGRALSWESYEEAVRAAIADAGADFGEALRNGGVWNPGSAPATPSPQRGLLADIAGRAAPADVVGSGEFQLMPYRHHTILDGRNAHLPWAQSTPDPLTTVTWQTWVDINEQQGRSMGLREGDVVNITTSAGSISALVYLNPGAPPGIAAVPMGGGRHSGSEYATGRDDRESSNVMSILAVAEVNGTGGLAWSGNRCSITPAGDSMAVSKLEGDYTSREVGEHSAEQVFKSVSEEDNH